MQPSFLIRLAAPSTDDVAPLAPLLAHRLSARGASVSTEDMPEGSGRWRVQITTTRRELPGSVATIGVLMQNGTARWLAPLPLEEGPSASVADGIVTFLERWGFIPKLSAPKHAS